MADPFSLFADPTGIAPPAPVANPKPAAPAPRSAAASMLAPGLTAPVQFPGLPAPQAQPQPQQAPVNDVDQFMKLVRAHESGGNDQASSGVANGRYQFTPATWAGVARQHPELGLQPNDIWNGEKQDLAMRAITRDYVNVLGMHNLPASMPNMFMLHFLGTGGGPKFLKAMQADPNANAAAMFPLEAKYNPTIFHDKAGQPRSLSQVYALMTKTFGGPAASMAPVDPAALKAQTQFEKAAGVPTQARDFTEGRAAAEGPPLPAGAQPLAAAPKLPAGAVPLPPGAIPIQDAGLKLDLNADKPLTKANPYAEAPKAKGASTPEIIGVEPTTGTPIFADDKENAKVREGEVEFGKGVAAGVAQNITGPASLLPNFLGGGYAEDANRALATTGSEAGRVVGNVAPMLLPAGEVAGAAKAGAKAVEEGASLLPSVAMAMGWGGAAGALSSTSNPVKSDTSLGRLEEKAKGAVVPGLVGGALSAAVPGGTAAAQLVGSEIGNFGKFVRNAFSKDAERAAEELRSGVSARTGQALTAEEKKAAEAKVEESAAKAKQDIADAQIKHLDAQQEKLRGRMQDRVKAAQAVADRAGLSARAARETAELRAAEVERAEQNAEKFAKDFAARPTTPEEEFGRQLQETAVKDAEALKAERLEKSGFAEAVASDGGKPSIPTKRFIAELDRVESRFVSDAAKGTIAKLKNELKTEVEDGKITKVSIERARRIVQDLDKRIDDLPSDEAHQITEVKDRFVGYMETVHPQLKEARQKYAEYSRPLDVYRDTGALAKSILEDPYSGRVVQDTTQTVGALLKKTENNAEALGRLIQVNPQLRDSARKYFNQELHDLAGVKDTPSPAQFDRFLRDNRLALDRAGLTDEFKDLATAKATQERIAAEAKAGAKAAERAAGDADKAAKKAEADVNAAKALKDRAAAASTLAAQRAGPEAARKEAVGELAKAAKTQQAAREAQARIREFENKLDPQVARTGQEVVQESNKLADWLYDNGHLDAAGHKELLAQIREVEQKNLDHVAAAKKMRQIISALGVFALGGVGVEAGRYLSHRVTP